MAVAKSYQKYKIIGEPFEENKRQYVILETGKKVRWYPETAEKPINSDFKVFGFDKGYITVFQGKEPDIEDWATAVSPSRARYATFLGWYVPSFDTVAALPTNIIPHKLMWDDVKDHMQDRTWVHNFVNNLTSPGAQSTSEYQGEVNEWLEHDVELIDKKIQESYYGKSYIYTFADSNGNEYVWSTSSKYLEINTRLRLRMKVKAHQEQNGVKQTVVYYCKVK